MKEDAFPRRRFSLCPPAATPQKAERRLARHLLLGGENEPGAPGAGKDMEPNGQFLPRDEGSSTPSSATTLPPVENRPYSGSDKESTSPTAKVTKKETLKAQKETYRQEKKRASRQLLSALTDPSVVIMADSLKIRGTLKSWTKLWCVLKPGVLLIYKTPKVGQWVGTVLLHCCELLERPSKKDGFCFKLFHPLDQSVWAVKGPKGESVGSITQPLPSSYLIFRAASESDGRCWLDALELALRCSSLLHLSANRQGRAGDPGSSPDTSPTSLCGLPTSASVHTDQDLFAMNGSSLDNDALSDKSDADAEAPDRHGPKTESGGDPPGTTYVEQAELPEVPEVSPGEPVSEENSSFLWLLLRQLRPGLDLSRVALPTFVLEPRSLLCRLADHYHHADLLSRAAQEDDPYSRLKCVLRWYLSGFYKKPKGIKKPYNPILGETFRCCWFHPQTNSRTFYVAEQVSHHPPVSAFHVSNRKDGFCLSGSVTAKSRFYGNSLSAVLDGQVTLRFLERAEDYTLTMPYAHCRGLLCGPMSLELGGRVTVECQQSRLRADLEFKLKPLFGSSSSINQIVGTIRSGDEVLARLTGRWDQEVLIREEGREGAELFWSPTEEVRRQRLTRQVVLLEEQTELESERLWQHVTRAVCEGDQHRAAQEKQLVEESQRRRAHLQRHSPVPWAPRLFRRDPATLQWRYQHENHRPWDPLKDVAQFERDGALHTLQRTGPGPHGSAQVSRVQMRKKRFRASRAPAQRPSPEQRLRKASDQPSGHGQGTESSTSTPESDEGSDFTPGGPSPCPRCGKETRQLRALHQAVLSVQESQLELQRLLASMLCRLQPRPAPGILRRLRSWVLLCVLLAGQLLLPYLLK